MGAFAKCDPREIIENFLQGKVSEIKKDPLTKLEQLKFPDKDFKKRYTQGLIDILSNYA
jgi:hypothetical protein